jgi:hypothetical protein
VDPGNYKVIDHYEAGEEFGASIKTINLASKQAKDPLEFRKLLDEYADQLKNFEGTIGTMRKANGTAFPVDSTNIGPRELVLTVGGRLPSMQQLRILSHWAKSVQSSDFNVVIFGGL